MFSIFDSKLCILDLVEWVVGYTFCQLAKLMNMGGFSQFIPRIAAIPWENNPNLLEAHYDSVVAWMC